MQLNSYISKIFDKISQTTTVASLAYSLAITDGYVHHHQ